MVSSDANCSRQKANRENCQCYGVLRDLRQTFAYRCRRAPRACDGGRERDAFAIATEAAAAGGLVALLSVDELDCSRCLRHTPCAGVLSQGGNVKSQ